MNRAESKYFTTAARMDEAFLALLEKKELAFITVKEICEKAGVNRSTFYLHYETVGDLLAESAQHVVDEFAACMPDTAEFLKRLPERPLEELYLITPEYLEPYLIYVREHRRVFRVVIEQAVSLRMDEAYAALSRHVLIPILERYQVPPEDQGYLLAYYIRGLLAVLDEWVKNDCKDSIGHVIAVMQRCVRR